MFRTRSGADARLATAVRRVGRWLGASLVALPTLTVLGWAAPAHAHIELVASSPETGAVVALSSDRILLVFGDDLFPVGNDVVVRGPDGADVTNEEPTVLESSLEAGINLATPGRHTVSYRAVGQDGHVIAGDLWFTAAADGLPLPPAAVVSQAVPSQPPEGITPLAWLLGAALGLAGLIVLIRTRARVAVRARHDDDGCAPRDP